MSGLRFDELELLAAYPFRSRARVLIDVGAHHGWGSLMFLQAGWRVVAFEPEPRNRAALLRNCQQFERFTCIPKAVSDTSGELVPLYVSDEHYGIHSLQPFHSTHRSVVTVETVRLDEALSALGVTDVSLVKIDVEGADLLALKGFDFANLRPEIVMVEFMDRRSQQYFGYTHHDMIRYLNPYGYVPFVSEWAPISEYSREGSSNKPHTWIQCVRYPLAHEPAWGNLIFVAEEHAGHFPAALRRYVRRLRFASLLRRAASVRHRVVGLLAGRSSRPGA